MHQSLSSAEKAAEFLRESAALAASERVGDFPETFRPADAGDAYAVQDLQVGDAPVGGWKILATGNAETYTCAPLAAVRWSPDGAKRPDTDSHMELEVEIAIRIVRDLPARDVPFTKAEVSLAAGGACAAFEIVETRFARRTDVSKWSALADFQSNYGVVVGSDCADWRQLNLPDLEISLELNGEVIRKSKKGASAEQTLDALTWLANHAVTRRCGGLRAGQFVITGARIGPDPMPPKGDLVARIESIGMVRMTR